MVKLLKVQLTLMLMRGIKLISTKEGGYYVEMGSHIFCDFNHCRDVWVYHDRGLSPGYCQISFWDIPVYCPCAVSVRLVYIWAKNLERKTYEDTKKL